MKIITNLLKKLKNDNKSNKINLSLKVNNRDYHTFTQIKSTYEKVRNMLEDSDIKIYTVGGSVPYLLLNQDSNRLHDDIDNICEKNDMNRLREIFKQKGLYKPEWDSINFVKDGVDYGFEMIIDGVSFGIFPYSYKNGMITQYSYDPYTTECKIKKIPIKVLSDYIMSYKGADGRDYNTMSLEYIKLTKDMTGRDKDLIDSKKISETGLLRTEVLSRIKMYDEIQKTDANELISKKDNQS